MRFDLASAVRRALASARRTWAAASLSACSVSRATSCPLASAGVLPESEASSAVISSRCPATSRANAERALASSSVRNLSSLAASRLSRSRVASCSSRSSSRAARRVLSASCERASSRMSATSSRAWRRAASASRRATHTSSSATRHAMRSPVMSAIDPRPSTLSDGMAPPSRHEQPQCADVRSTLGAIVPRDTFRTQYLACDTRGERRVVTLSSEHAHESTQSDLVLEAAHRAQALAHESFRKLLVALGLLVGEVREGRLSDRLVDTGAPQLEGERPGCEPPGRPPRRDEHPRVRGIVEQPDFCKAIEHTLGDPGLDPLAGESLTELVATARGSIERSQGDRPRHLVGIRLGIVCRRSRARRLRDVPHRAQKSTGGSAGWSTWAPMPSFSLIFFSISAARSGLSRKKVREFSLP